MDPVVCRKGLDAAKTFSENGGWQDFASMLHDLGITEEQCADLWWETTEIPPTDNEMLDANHETIPLMNVVRGRGFPEEVDSVIWGSKQEVRIIDLDSIE